MFETLGAPGFGSRSLPQERPPGEKSADLMNAYPTPLVPPIFPADLAKLTLTSTSWPDGGIIPAPSVADGNNISPQLTWSKGPAGTASYVVTMFDPDAPTGVGWWHWLAFNIPPGVTSLDQDASRNMPSGIVQGLGDAGVSGYFGPAPPPGDKPHHYYITVSALDKMIPPNHGASTSGALLAFLMSKEAKVLARGQYLGMYGR